MTGGRTVSVTGEGSEWYAAHPYTVKLTIRERACGVTLGATLTITLKSFQGHAAICTIVPQFEAASSNCPPDEKNSLMLTPGIR